MNSYCIHIAFIYIAYPFICISCLFHICFMSISYEFMSISYDFMYIFQDPVLLQAAQFRSGAVGAVGAAAVAGIYNAMRKQ